MKIEYSGPYIQVEPDTRPIVGHLDRPDVAEMADFNHVPTEQWISHTQPPNLYCKTCIQAYPCATRLELDKIQNAR